MNRASRPSNRRATSSTTSTVGPQTRLVQYFGRRDSQRTGLPLATSRRPMAQESLVGRRAGRDPRGSPAHAREGWRLRLRRAVTGSRLRIVRRDDDVSEGLHGLLAALGLGQDPVRPGLSETDTSHVDLGRVRLEPGPGWGSVQAWPTTPGTASRQASSRPRACGRGARRPPIGVDQTNEKRTSPGSWFAVRGRRRRHPRGHARAARASFRRPPRSRSRPRPLPLRRTQRSKRTTEETASIPAPRISRQV